MTPIQSHGLSEESCKSCRRVKNSDISTEVPEDSEDPGTNTPWNMQTNPSDNTPQQQQHTRKTTSQNKNKSSQSNDNIFASSTTETPPPTEQDWSSGDTALKIHFEMKTGKNVFQKTLQKYVCFLSHVLQRRDASKFFERRMSRQRKQFDPVNQKEIKNYTMNDVLEKTGAAR